MPVETARANGVQSQGINTAGGNRLCRDAVRLAVANLNLNAFVAHRESTHSDSLYRRGALLSAARARILRSLGLLAKPHPGSQRLLQAKPLPAKNSIQGPTAFVLPTAGVPARPAHPNTENIVDFCQLRVEFHPDTPGPELCWAKRERYKLRTMSERVNARWKDEFGANRIRVRGAAKVMAHLMFGVLALTVDQWLRLAPSPTG